MSNSSKESAREGIRTVGHVFPSLAESHRHNRDLAFQQLTYAIDRRDKLIERIRFGLVALNGASLLALLSALGGNGEAAKWLGFDEKTAYLSATAFAVGLVAAAIATVAQQNLYVSEAGDAAVRAHTYKRLASQHLRPATEKAMADVENGFKEEENLPLVGFQYSVVSNITQNASAGAWLVGILIPLIGAVQWPF